MNKDNAFDVLESYSASPSRAPTESEMAALIDLSRKDADVLEALMACARQRRNECLGHEEVLEAAFNSVVPCRLQPLCRYCPYWRNSANLPMPIADVVANVADMVATTPIRQLHLSGGTTRGEAGIGADCGIIERVAAIRDAGFNDVRIVVNCGAAFSDAELARMKDLGVMRVFSVFETLNPELFASMKPGDDLEAKKEFAARIADAHLEVGTGLMAGLGEYEQRPVDYAYALAYIREMPRLACVYISKFRHAAGIEINDHEECPLPEALAFVAMARIALPRIHIRAAAGWSADEHDAARKAGEGNIRIAHSYSTRSGAWVQQ